MDRKSAWKAGYFYRVRPYERRTTNIELLLSNVENILLNGTQLILNRVFQRIGFDRIDDELLKHLVVARLC